MYLTLTVILLTFVNLSHGGNTIGVQGLPSYMRIHARATGNPHAAWTLVPWGNLVLWGQTVLMFSEHVWGKSVKNNTKRKSKFTSRWQRLSNVPQSDDMQLCRSSHWTVAPPAVHGHPDTELAVSWGGPSWRCCLSPMPRAVRPVREDALGTTEPWCLLHRTCHWVYFDRRAPLPQQSVQSY